MCSYEDITDEDKNYVEYQTMPSSKWSPCLFERSVVETMLESEFGRYMERVKKTDCQAELRRLLAAGPPVWLSDKNGLPLSDGDEYVSKLWFASDNLERSARLKGSKIGKERDDLLEELKEFVVVEGGEGEGDEDDEEKK